MYQILIYHIDSNLWRWELRWGRTLLRCGAVRSKVAAINEADEAVKI